MLNLVSCKLPYSRHELKTALHIFQNVTTDDVSGGQNHQVFAEVKIEPEDDTAVYRDKDFSSAQTASATVSLDF